MIQCPRCGGEADYLAGDAFVLVRCDFCDDVIEIGDLVLAGAPPVFPAWPVSADPSPPRRRTVLASADAS